MLAQLEQDWKYCCLITGGSRGIGKQIALAVARKMQIVILGRDEKTLKQTVQEIKLSKGWDCYYYVGDILEDSIGYWLSDFIRSRDLILKHVVLNAGEMDSAPIGEMSQDMIHKMIDVNIKGNIFLLNHLVPELKKNGGGSVTIINSISGLRASKNNALYSASKFALKAVADSLREECARDNISVSSIYPGYTEGERTESSIKKVMQYKGLDYQEARNIIANRNSQKRILDPREIADAVLYSMLGEASSDIYLEGETDYRIIKLVSWIRDNTENSKKLLIPISGGSDSALVFKLCSIACPHKVIGTFFGSYKNLRSREYFESIGKVIYLDFIPHGEEEIYRWAKFQNLSRTENAWLVGSRNATEQALGTYSIASKVATFLPISGVYKSQVLELCNLLGIPEEITNSSRQADPECGRPQELADINIEELDEYLKTGVGLIVKEQKRYIESIIRKNKFKSNIFTGINI